MLASEMVAAVKGQVGFDTSGANVTDATILSWVNARYRDLCARSKYVKASLELGPAVAGTAAYAIPASVSEILALRLDSGSEAVRVKTEQMWSLRSQQAALTGPAVVAYAPAFGSDGAQTVEIYPTPTVSGGSVQALAVTVPSALTLSPDTSPVVPVDFHEALVSGAIAMGLERQDGRFDVSAGFNGQFEAAVQLLKRRAVARVGQGPVQFPVAGVHF